VSSNLNQTPTSEPLIRIESPGATSVVLDRFIKAVDPYKQILVLITTVAGGGWVVHDYFATRKEVSILRCRSDAQMSAIEARMEMERIRLPLEQAALRVEPSQDRKTPLPLDQEKRHAMDTLARMDHQKLQSEYAQHDKTLASAKVRLKPGICEGLADEKPLKG
jgi:hypothetical protein